METTTNSRREWVSVGEDLGWRESQQQFMAVNSPFCPVGLTMSAQKAESLIKYLQTITMTTSSAQWDEGKLQVFWDNKIGDLKLDWDFKKGLNVKIICPWTRPSGQFRSWNVSHRLICADRNEQFLSFSYPPTSPPCIFFTGQHMISVAIIPSLKVT